MLPIRLIETEREDFEGPIVELWRDDVFIGMVFWDGEAAILQVYPDGDDVHDLDVRELQPILDTATRIVDPEAFDREMDELREAASAGDPETWGDEHPATAALLAEFDSRAVHRSVDGEGFFTKDTAMSFIARCEELDLAVVEMDGLTLADGEVDSIEGLDLELPDQPTMTWSGFRSYCNATAQSVLGSWPGDPALVVAFVLRQPDGEDIVA
jgi:hypothetical protein